MSTVNNCHAYRPSLVPTIPLICLGHMSLYKLVLYIYIFIHHIMVAQQKKKYIVKN